NPSVERFVSVAVLLGWLEEYCATTVFDLRRRLARRRSFHTAATLRSCAALFLRLLPECKAGLRDSSAPKYRSAGRSFTGGRFMDPGDRSSNGDSGGVDCVFGPEQRRFSGHPRGPRRNSSDDRPWRLVAGCLALRQKAYRASGALELYLKRRNPNSVHQGHLLYPYFGFRENATGGRISFRWRGK